MSNVVNFADPSNHVSTMGQAAPGSVAVVLTCPTTGAEPKPGDVRVETVGVLAWILELGCAAPEPLLAHDIPEPSARMAVHTFVPERLTRAGICREKGLLLHRARRAWRQWKQDACPDPVPLAA